MGWAFRAAIPHAGVAKVRRWQGRWCWAIGIHTNFRGRWLVNGSCKGIVALDVDPPARARALVPIKIRMLGVSLADPDGFVSALQAAATSAIAFPGEAGSAGSPNSDPGATS
jgi:hypothetical protein